ncbi:ABC transporter substrate-binding protein [Devosia sp. 2618]|uniref:ABC transporter substrate-binding protein n=1 Tax=Devosia sp. 2618 TaxID=3156454 RepID=UPI00339744B1
MKLLIAAAAILGGLLAGPVLAQETRPFEAGNGTIGVPVKPLRIVSLHDLSITLPLVEFGATDLVVGSHGRLEEDKVPYIRGAKELYETSFENTDIVFLGVFNQIDLELIAGLEPDLIIGRFGNDNDVLPNLEKIAPTVLLDQDKLGFFGSMQAVADLGGVLPEYDRQFARYQAQIAEFKRLVPNPADISIAILQPWPEDGYIAANKEYYALSQVLDDVGFSKPDLIAEISDSSLDMSPEFLPEVDADFIFSTYEGLYPDQRSPDEIRAAFEKVVPGYCTVLQACRNNQMVFIPRTPIYSSSFRSLTTAYQQVLTHVAGRAFVPLAK